MLLRRIIEHVKTQNWTAVFLDFVIVVVGVFIGIQVANWNDARGEREAEIEYLAALEQDVAFSLRNLERLSASLDLQEEARRKLFAYSLDPEAVMDESERDRLLSHGVFHLPPLNISQVTFEALKSSGRLGVIKSPALVSGLQSLSAEVADVLVTQEDEIDITHEFSDPLLIDHFDLRGVFQQPTIYGNVSIGWLSPDRVPALAPEPDVVKTQRFRNVLLYRSYFTESRKNDIGSILEQYKEIATLIDERQAELGIE